MRSLCGLLAKGDTDTFAKRGYDLHGCVCTIIASEFGDAIRWRPLKQPLSGQLSEVFDACVDG